MTPLTEDENDYHEKVNKCFICNKRFPYDDHSKDFKNYRKIRDHCHYTGKYRGTAHSICNLRYRTTEKISAVFHNGSLGSYYQRTYKRI